MLSRKLLGSLILAGMVAVGCEKKSESTTQPADAADKAKTAVTDTAHTMSDKAGDMKDAAKDAMKDATGAMKDATSTAKDSSANSMDQAKAALGGEDPQTLMEKAMQYIKEKKLDDAQTIVDKLDAAKSKLPADWAAKVDQLKAMLTTAKAGSGALPGGLSLPK